MTPVSTAIKYYSENYCKTDGSKTSYLALSNKFPRLVQTYIEELTPAMIVTEFNDTTLKHSTKKLYYFNLKSAIYRFCSDHKMTPVNLDGLFRGESKQRAEIQYLTLDEVKQIKAFDPVKVRRKKAKDLFLLMCLSGMAIGDAFSFDPEKHMTPDGKYFAYNRKKTGTLCLIPVIDDAKEIIDRYEGRWPFAEREIGGIRTFNNHCKWIGDIVGRKVSAHTARKTMGCVFLEFGFSLEAISSFLGHQDTATSARYYARVSRNKIEYEIDRIPRERLTITQKTE